MSFDFSIGDIIKLIELTTRTYTDWKNACGTYATITDNLAALCALLVRIEVEVHTPNSLFSKNKDDLQHWETLSEGCYDVVAELTYVLNKYRSLSTSRARNWDRIRLGNKSIDGLNTRLLMRIESVSAFATVVGVSSQGRVENVIFPELLRRMDGIAAEIRKGTSSIGTLTTYENDDKTVWKEFRREMIRADVRSRDIHRYKVSLKTYLLRLKHEGLLDEEIPEEDPSSKRTKDGEPYGGDLKDGQPDNDRLHVADPSSESEEDGKSDNDSKYIVERILEDTVSKGNGSEPEEVPLARMSYSKTLRPSNVGTPQNYHDDYTTGPVPECEGRIHKITSL
ncbi:uncharacterized protein N0V89_012376 [Didymosphaeria variabile]|uniref:Fungal N-terminal domain-containing protein n=1 Tax=Didymosphaeria variabile TaxID=1932322 RepID=A0A9W8XAD8_9PLEO|nr:uncharacterized protein N0V89_012376 [Didymosphaeria variabile]KAJ4344632.1 hypothetical protein N0V89_012376 [Didymosphaeria variabile]